MSSLVASTLPVARVTRITDGLPVFYVDCAGRPEDILALAYLASSPKVHLAGVGISGSGAHAAHARETITALLGSLGLDDIVVASDAASATARDDDANASGRRHLRDVSAHEGHEPDARSRAGVRNIAAELIVGLARKHNGRLRIVALGPVTNVAAALRLETDLPALVKEVTVSGGAVFVCGDANGSVGVANGAVGVANGAVGLANSADAVAEADFAADAASAAAVVSAEWPITLFPLDVSADHVIDDAQRRSIADSDGPVGRAISALGMGDARADRLPVRGSRDMRIPLTVGVATGELVPHSAPTMQITVDLEPAAHRGRTRYRIIDMGVSSLGAPYRNRARQQCRVVLSVHRAADAFLVDRALALDAVAPSLGREIQSA